MNVRKIQQVTRVQNQLPLDSPVALRWLLEDNSNRCRLVSFADMILHDCPALYELCRELSRHIASLCPIELRNVEVPKHQLAEIESTVASARKLVHTLGITDPTFKADVNDVGCDLAVAQDEGERWLVNMTADRLAHDLQRLQRGLLLELQRRKFVYVAPPNDQYFEQDRLFGDAVHLQFPSARFDLKEAGNALSVELYTACVFHLMRVAELGMRALAYDRRITKLPRKKDAPVDMGTWEEIIKELEEQADKIANWPNKKGKIKVQAQEFYNSLNAEFRGFKDAWRNHIAHKRRNYTREDAISVLSHVKRLMCLLSTRISESERTPLVWTKAELR